MEVDRGTEQHMKEEDAEKNQEEDKHYIGSSADAVSGRQGQCKVCSASFGSVVSLGRGESMAIITSCECASEGDPEEETLQAPTTQTPASPLANGGLLSIVLSSARVMSSTAPLKDLHLMKVDRARATVTAAEWRFEGDIT